MANYPLIPDRILTTAPEFKTTTIVFESGHEQRSPNMSGNKPTFRIEHNLLNNTDLQTLVDFFTARKGSYESFIFYNYRDATNYTVKFKDDKLRIEHINAFFSKVRAELQVC
jgi:uncharacterized protein (TIGR02217 family)